MKLIIAGANGFLGRYLARYFTSRGHEVVGLVRRPADTQDYRPVRWDGATLGAWSMELDGADALINLAGRSVNCRYHARNRAEICESRRASTRILGDACEALEASGRYGEWPAIEGELGRLQQLVREVEAYVEMRQR